MNYEVVVTCAVTCAGDTVGRHPGVPVTPEQVADAAIESARAGAAIAQMHCSASPRISAGRGTMSSRS